MLNIDILQKISIKFFPFCHIISEEQHHKNNCQQKKRVLTQKGLKVSQQNQELLWYLRNADNPEKINVFVNGLLKAKLLKGYTKLYTGSN